MIPVFISTYESPEISLSRVAEIRRSREGWILLDSESRKLGTAHRHPDDTIVSVIPAPPGEWELLIGPGFNEEPDPNEVVYAEPVLAWGVTLGGYLRPIIPTALDGADSENHMALRRVGQPAVYLDGEGRYDSAAAWLTALRESRQPKAAGKADA